MKQVNFRLDDDHLDILEMAGRDFGSKTAAIRAFIDRWWDEVRRPEQVLPPYREFWKWTDRYPAATDYFVGANPPCDHLGGSVTEPQPGMKFCFRCNGRVD